MAIELPKTGGPAARALAGVGITSLEDVTAWTERDLAALHGVGAKAIGILREAMQPHGLDFTSV
jgi:predicted flap endonuclease-1-like 5' DNA nuclease